MAKIVANSIYEMNGVTIWEKIIPDGTVWTNDVNAKKAGFSAGALYKKNQKLTGGSGKARFVTIHNTNDLAGVFDDGEQYTRATFNENMGAARVHFYVDENGAWQNLKAGTGLTNSDAVGAAEVGWHAGDGSVSDGGNMTSLALEIIMGEGGSSDMIAKDNGARIAAYLLWRHGLGVDALVSHTYWVNKTVGNVFSDVDEQCTNLVYSKKWCPCYIFNSYDHSVALENWKAFKALVRGYLNTLCDNEGSNINGRVSDGSDKDAAYIWNYLSKKIKNPYGVAGLMGNLYAESGLRSDNMENSYEKKLGYSDTSYTAAVDGMNYGNFVYDSVGYGLAQWTFWSRKQNLLNFARAANKSIGDVDMQLDFLCDELEKSFPIVYLTLQGAGSVKEASDAVLLDFERPANQSASMREKRAAYGRSYFNKFADIIEEDEDMTIDKFKELMREYRAELQDNDCGEWSREAREWAINSGFIAGNGANDDGTPMYAWADGLTREQAAMLFYRFAKLMGKA